MNAWRTRHVDAAGAVCLVALTAGGYLLGVAPMLRQRALVGVLEARIAAAEQESDRLATTASALDELLQSMQERLSSSTLRLEPAGFINQRVFALKRLAVECGLALDDVQPGVLHSGELYRTMPVTISGTGSYADCARFLHRLRADLADTTVQTATITIGDADSPPTFTFELTWYAAPAGHAGHPGE